MTEQRNPIEALEALLTQITLNQRSIETRAASAPENHLPDLRVIWRGMQADKRALEAHLKGLTSDQHPS